MSQVVVATYNVFSVFKIPRGVDIETLMKKGLVFVKWNLLHVRIGDKDEDEDDKNWLQIEPELDVCELKRPSDITIEKKSDWLGEEDEEQELHICKNCNDTMTDENFKEGKMCCDKPMFHDDEESE